MISTEPVWNCGPFHITAYSLFILAGALAGVLLSGRKKEVRPLLPAVILAALVLGHVCWVLFCPPAYVREDGKGSMMLRIWEGGYTLYGSLAGGALAAVLGAKLLKLRPLKVLDALTPGACAALLLARIGEAFSQVGSYDAEGGIFYPGQGFGDLAMTDEIPLPFPLAYCTYQDQYYAEWRYAVWLWEAAVALILLICLLTRARKAAEGRQTALFLTVLGTTQILLEQFRKDDYTRLNQFVRFSQIAALASLIAVLAVLLARRKPRRAVTFLSIGVLAFGSLSVMWAEFAFDKPQYYIFLYLSLGLAALTTAALLCVTRKRGSLAAVPILAASAALIALHAGGRWETPDLLLYSVMALSLLMTGLNVLLVSGEKAAVSGTAEG